MIVSNTTAHDIILNFVDNSGGVVSSIKVPAAGQQTIDADFLNKIRNAHAVVNDWFESGVLVIAENTPKKPRKLKQNGRNSNII